MLYVFHVDVGRMMSFDMAVALSSVENLKDTIERLHNISASTIVLLVSGGDMLLNNTQVSNYSAGTDTNPIYMFLNGDGRPTLPMSQPVEGDIDLTKEVERCLELPAVYDTVVKRAQLAARMDDLAREGESYCERLVHEQHLQQQGWSAVVANMEDLTEEFKQRYQNFCLAFDSHLEKRENHLQLLENFNDDLKKLSRIPILPGLMPLAEANLHGFEEFLDTDEVFSRSHRQQESVVMMVGADKVEITATGGGEERLSVGETGEGEDKNNTSTSSTSTSPNKKLKMANETSTEEQISGALVSMVTTGSDACSGSGLGGLSSNRRYGLNLLQWITSKENHDTLRTMAKECLQGLEAFNKDIYEKLNIEVQGIIKIAEQGDVKEIKGLSDRLCKLEELRYKVKKMVQDQKELSTAFQQNQNRAMNLRDASILPDLCDSHQSQLLVMLQNHQKIRDYLRLIAKAKDELGQNLHMRLKRIVWIENKMSDFDNGLLFHHRCLRRAERHIHIIGQIHEAPRIYVDAVTEVVRRKIFSSEFRLWASKLAEDFEAIHNEEINRREKFNARFEGHFLNILFPGMSDMPPAFANENPLIFDARLPNITKSDIDFFTSYLPDLATAIDLPDMRPVINFFVSRSGEHQRERWEELLKQQITSAQQQQLQQKPPPFHQRLNKLHEEASGGGAGGCEESETDTETDFETVQPTTTTQTVATSTGGNGGPLQAATVTIGTATEPMLMQSAATLTDENTATMREELERLRGILGAMWKLSVNCIRVARTNLASIRSDAATYRDDLESEIEMLNEKWRAMQMQYEAREQQWQERSLERDEELRQMRETLAKRETELAELEEKCRYAEEDRIKCGTLDVQIEMLSEQLKAADRARQEAVAKVREELTHEHKTAIESLRSRFKLMTSMELSPSETSLEKLERPTSAASGNIFDSSSSAVPLDQHEAKLAELRATLEAEKEKAIEAERSVWKENQLTIATNVGVLKDMLERKEQQLQQLREKDLLTTKENYQLKVRLDGLVNGEGSSWMREKIEYLVRDKSRLEAELSSEKTRRAEMESSIAALRSSMYEQNPSVARSRTCGNCGHRCAVLESCARGDIVFVVWNQRHGQFVVVQDSSSLYFVHGESLDALNLQLPSRQARTDGLDGFEPPIPIPYYAIGRVVDKEYCQARKDENRYRVTRGSKFYRIKLAPLTAARPSMQPSRRERLESYTSSSAISRSVSQSESHSESLPSLGAAFGGPSVGTGIGTTPSRDVVDSGHGPSMSATELAPLRRSEMAVAVMPASVMIRGDAAAGASASTVPQIKEHTMIVANDDDDAEPLSLLSDHCRYISVSEEDGEDLTMTVVAGAADAPIEKLLQGQEQEQQQSVITEQPTASNKLHSDLMLMATSDDAKPPHVTTTTTTPTDTSTPIVAAAAAAANVDGNGDGEVATDDVDATTPSTLTATPMDTSLSSNANQAITPTSETAAISTMANTTTTTTTTTTTSVCTTSEDSDEYRSLEGKDDIDDMINTEDNADNEFPLSE